MRALPISQGQKSFVRNLIVFDGVDNHLRHLHLFPSKSPVRSVNVKIELQRDHLLQSGPLTLSHDLHVLFPDQNPVYLVP